MSLLLVQGYESPEEEPPKFLSDSDEDGAGEEAEQNVSAMVKPSKPQQTGPPPRTSILPTAYEMFTEVTGPPDFLKNSMTSRSDGGTLQPVRTPLDFTERYVAPKVHKERPPPAAVAVVEARAQGAQLEQDTDKSAVEAKRRAPGAGLPPAEDAANLLRMCLNCGVPKTYSGAKEGMVCPLCGDRPAAAGGPNAAADKRRGNKVKDKEHSKRMKGQSAHATWKSESEMHLRQQFD